MINIAIGSDHGGFEYKAHLIKDLKEKGYNLVDCGCFSSERANYAEFAIETAKKVGSGECEYGILVCNSGEGVSIAANKVKGARCGIGYNDEVSHLIKEHNNANMIAFGAHFATYEEVLNRINIFLNATFEGGRHLERVNKIIDFEK